MKNIFFAVMASFMVLTSCEYFDSPEDTLNLEERKINYPNIFITGESFIVYDIRETNPVYEDAGATALFGPTEDITDEIVTSGVEDVDSNVGGFYEVDYSVSRVNSLGQVVSDLQTRTVVTTNPDDDLSGNWSLVTTNAGWNGTGSNTSGDPGAQTLTQLGIARFQIPSYFNGGLASNVLDRNVELRIAGDLIIVPEHGSQFGINWAGVGAVVSRDAITDEVTEFYFDWNSTTGFNGNAIMARNVYTRL